MYGKTDTREVYLNVATGKMTTTVYASDSKLL